MILCHKLRYGISLSQFRVARPDSRQPNLLDSVTQLDCGVQPRRTVHAIQDGLVLKPSGRGGIKWA